ncbi:MAG: hypothetical protein RL088_946 [Verrucomicrobiota bacterium]|jgi:hypothetical protein
MKQLFIFLTIVLLVRADAAEFRAYKATASITFVSSIYENNTDRFLTVKMSNKQLINLALGQPQKSKSSKDLALVVMAPSATSSPLPVTLAVLNVKTGQIVRSVAGITAGNILTPTDPTKPVVALVSLTFAAQSAPDFAAQAFALRGSGVASARLKGTSVFLNTAFSGLHGDFTRTDAAGLNAYASVVTSGSLRVSGKPLATIEL